MHDLDDLRRQFSILGVVTIEPGQNGLPRVVVTTPDAEAHVYLHGAQVTHYRRPGRPPVLFMSARSWFEPGRPIRGGVPIVFPWFGPSKIDPAFPAHGFARTRQWTLRSVDHDTATSVVTLSLALADDDATRLLWPHAFEAVHTVAIGPALGMALAVRNTGSSPFTFEAALHTYLSIGDVRRVTVTGLGGRDFVDNMDGRQLKTQPPEPITFTAETERIYLATPDAVTVTDPAAPGGSRRAITVGKDGSLATVIWNPWVTKAKAMPDFGDEEWPAMVCIETANIAGHAITLAPGQRHVMRADLRDDAL
jgi:glucose-6-phosphate 1-epimerase